MAWTYNPSNIRQSNGKLLVLMYCDSDPPATTYPTLNDLKNAIGYVAGEFNFTPFFKTTFEVESEREVNRITLLNGNYVKFLTQYFLSGTTQYVRCTLQFYTTAGSLLYQIRYDYQFFNNMYLNIGIRNGFYSTVVVYRYIYGSSNGYRGENGWVDTSTFGTAWNNWVTGATSDNPYHFSPDNPTAGGFGQFDYSSEDDDFPSLPAISATDAGFCTLYKMTSTQVKDLASYLWGLGSLASFLPVFSDPMECILSLGIMPVEPTSSGNYYIKVGNLTTTVQGALVDSQYFELDCGSVTIDGTKWANGFMNYSPYTKAELYLPFIGTVNVSIDEIMDSTISLKYHIDLLSGSCVAYIKVSKNYITQGATDLHENVLYQFSGNVLTNIPITSQNFTQVLQAVIGAVASGADKGLSVGTKGSQSAGISNEINQMETMKPHIQRSGNMSSSCGFMGERTPKVILSFPKLCIANNQGKELGYPRYQECQLSTLSGYTTCYKVHLSNIKCTDSEREEINGLLSSGVVLPTFDPSLTLSGSNNIGVYTYTAEKIALDKQTGTTLIDQMQGYFREACDVLDPVITITPTTNLTADKILKEANYVYLKNFGRFYYIKKMTALAKDLIQIELHVDVLMSWASAIRLETVIVERNEKAWNLFMSDGAIRTENDPYNVVLHFPSGFSDEQFLLAVAGTPSSTPT